MATTNFTDKETAITADWLNDADNNIYGLSAARIDSRAIYLSDYLTSEQIADTKLSTPLLNLSSPFQNAINATEAIQGVLVLPIGGKVRIATGLTIDSKMTLFGYGYSENSGNGSVSEIIKASTLNGTGLIVSASAVTLQGFTMEGESANGGDGIVISGTATHVTLRDIASHNQGNDGIVIGGQDGTGTMNNWHAQNIVTHSNGNHGFVVDYGAASTDANAGVLTHLDSFNNTNDGLNVDGAAGCTFTGVTVQQNGQYGVYLGENSSKNIFFGGDFNESNVTDDLFLAAGAEQNCFYYPALTIANTTDNGTGTYIHTADTPGTKTASVETNAVATGTIVTPWDDTIPQNTEGTQVMELTSIIKGNPGTTYYYITVTVSCAHTSNGNITVSLFEDSTADAIAATTSATLANDPKVISFTKRHLAPAGNSTYRVRVGSDAAGTITINGVSSARRHGGVSVCSIAVVEGGT